ncbi:zinc-binding dehydrogenase [Hydrogenophaga borbori]|uniref:zinc-binding dehydrogenase n=1 Tax=Hydrogenophaga borbori TaxID=2294117 RepID=UPI00301CA2E3
MTLPASHCYVSKKWQDCNWVQCLEGAIDTAHFSFLHMVVAQDEAQALAMLQHAAIGAQGEQNARIRWVRDDPMPRFEINETHVGLTIGGARRADDGQLYWRIAQFMQPNHALVPSAFPGENYHGQTFVPVDDRSCWIYTYTWNPDRPLTEQELERCRRGHTVHAEVDGRGVDVVLDMVAGPYLARDLEALAVDGRIAVIAFMGGTQATIDVIPLLRKRAQVTGSTLRPCTVEHKAAIAQELLARIWPHLDKGHGRPAIEAVFSPAQAADAHRLMESGSHFGKLLLEMDGSLT